MPEDPAEECGHPDGAADVRADAERGAGGGEKARLAAAGAAHDVARVVRVAGAAVHRVVGLPPHAALGHVGQRQRDAAGRAEPGNRPRVGRAAQAGTRKQTRRVQQACVSASLPLGVSVESRSLK